MQMPTPDRQLCHGLSVDIIHVAGIKTEGTACIFIESLANILEKRSDPLQNLDCILRLI